MNKRVVELPVLNPLRQQVTDILRTAIAKCQFEPGGRLTERELCEMLKVSRSTIRESLRQLETEGLVRITPNKGPVVTALDETEARELYGIRAQLEAYSTSMLARNPDPAVIKTLENHLADMRTDLRQKNFDSLQTNKTLFYHALFEASGNKQLTTMLKQLRARNALIRGADHRRAERMKESVDGAAKVLKAVKSGDVEEAAKASHAHLERAADMAIDALRGVTELKTVN
tara:strand:- start:9066 stop:9755 length:690 start_codon:yes stop_codon:yes gene_type:complete